MKRMLFCFGLLCCGSVLSAQITVRLTVESGSSQTTCTDPADAPDPLWQVSVNGGSFETYPAVGACYRQPPFQQYTATYDCPDELPIDLEVCFEAFESDGTNGCNIVKQCPVSLCDRFTIPPLGQRADYNLAISQTEVSSGQVRFSIETTGQGPVVNDTICSAVDLGVISYGDTLGDGRRGLYNNICATGVGDPNPQTLGSYFTNEAGVWFRFNSGANSSGMLAVEVFSDPDSTGDAIDTEVAVFTTDNDACDGQLRLYPVTYTYGATFNTVVQIICPDPNTDFFILVDGQLGATDEFTRGLFGIQVWDPGVADGGDRRCDFHDLGTIPTNGSVGTTEPQANYCGTGTDDPFTPSFVSQHSVWFRFVAPPSGHVMIDAVSDRSKDSIDLQLAVYRSINQQCTGFFSHVSSSYTLADIDEHMEMSCLFPGQVYFILVDGGGNDARGIFNISVSDAGDITPVTTIDTVLCFGGSLRVGNKIHGETGTYRDTLQVFAGCDSIVISNITVLDEIKVDIAQIRPAIGQGTPNGIASVSALGGGGGYTYQWCSGETGPQATQLVGGANCCVTVTDANDCEKIACFTVDFTTPISPSYRGDTLACFGDENGEIVFSASQGRPPYSYRWQEQTGALSGSGNIAAANESVTIPNLAAGVYSFTISDAFLDTTFLVTVTEPPVLTVALDSLEDASCFGVCDGRVAVVAGGGTPVYGYTWSSGGSAPLLNNLCAGNYGLTITDANGCKAELNAVISEPPEFIATAKVVQEVSCFEGRDGVATVTTNGNPIDWLWSNGENTATISDLTAGFYDVTVTNGDGCTDQTGVNIKAPTEPLSVRITESRPISCFGLTDGALSADVDGPFNSLTYSWNTGQTSAVIDNLGDGSYSLMVTNEKGCTAEANTLLVQPTAIEAIITPRDITCLDEATDGAISLDQVTGGRPDYRYSLDGKSFSPVPVFNNLTEGNYTVYIRDQSGCELVQNVGISGPPELSVSLGEDLSIRLGDSLRLFADASSQNVRFEWSVDAGANGPNLGLRPPKSITVRVEAMDTLTFCRATDALFITVDRRPRIFIPNAFSPNDDGQNDYFFPYGGDDIVEIVVFRVFDRRGRMLFHDQNFQPGDFNHGWDGRFNNQPLSSGTYIYYAEVALFDGTSEIVKGEVVLLR